MSTWLRRFGPPVEPRARLVCFPHAGAAADSYSDLARALAPEIDVYAVQYPGRQDRRDEEPLGTAGEIGDEVATVLRARDAEGPPFALFGHSMGALVAYETARRLEREPRGRPVRLFTSGQTAPHVHERRTDLPDDDGLLDELRRLGTNETALADEELLTMSLPVLRADYQVLRSYVWQDGPPLRAGITALCGDADPLTAVGDAERWLQYSVIPGRTRTFPGGHFYLEDQVTEVAGAVRRDLLRTGLADCDDHEVGSGQLAPHDRVAGQRAPDVAVEDPGPLVPDDSPPSLCGQQSNQFDHVVGNDFTSRSTDTFPRG
ncbi:thioesterase II family protein [Actinopolyspora erythraea]|uniref:Type II thioesterase n=1 Tax=Actinopolyspora erythraea TaxID=414996 RepID=A0A096ZP62_9ACTN|nr:alpha/beta fold hydrolase [Actinopolyspora erythraea]AIS23779.1 type II thioesterase [Actinopolyspora erythraea]